MTDTERLLIAAGLLLKELDKCGDDVLAECVLDAVQRNDTDALSALFEEYREEI